MMHWIHTLNFCGIQHLHFALFFFCVCFFFAPRLMSDVCVCLSFSRTNKHTYVYTHGNGSNRWYYQAMVRLFLRNIVDNSEQILIALFNN